MLSLRAGSRRLSQRLGAAGVYGQVARRSLAVTACRAQEAPVAPTELAPKSTTEVAAPADGELQQAPNRAGVWTRNQQPRSKAMTGPRFEQTDFSVQVGAPRCGCSLAFLHIRALT